MKNRPLFSDGQTLKTLTEFNEKTVYNLLEDITCLKEEIGELKDDNCKLRMELANWQQSGIEL
jgi:regulator of replication initiation timing